MTLNDRQADKALRVFKKHNLSYGESYDKFYAFLDSLPTTDADNILNLLLMARALTIRVAEAEVTAPL
jgi:hypothetical protein